MQPEAPPPGARSPAPPGARPHPGGGGVRSGRPHPGDPHGAAPPPHPPSGHRRPRPAAARPCSTALPHLSPSLSPSLPGAYRRRRSAARLRRRFPAGVCHRGSVRAAPAGGGAPRAGVSVAPALSPAVPSGPRAAAGNVGQRAAGAARPRICSAAVRGGQKRQWELGVPLWFSSAVRVSASSIKPCSGV